MRSAAVKRLRLSYQPSPRHGSRSVSAMPSFTVLACGSETTGPIAPLAGSYQATPRSANTYTDPSVRNVFAAQAGTGPCAPLSTASFAVCPQIAVFGQEPLGRELKQAAQLLAAQPR